MWLTNVAISWLAEKCRQHTLFIAVDGAGFWAIYKFTLIWRGNRSAVVQHISSRSS